MIILNEQKLMDWSREVKIKDHWVCQDCGELDKFLLESHHTNPKSEYPELAFDLDNGECVCLTCHANRHKDNPIIFAKILLRLEMILNNRLHKIIRDSA